MDVPPAPEPLRQQDRTASDAFERAPVALVLVEVGNAIDEVARLRAACGDSCAAYIDEHPGEVLRLADLARPVRANEATVRLFEAETEAECLRRLTEWSLPESLPLVRALILAFLEGRRQVEGETTHRTARGENRHVRVGCTLPLPGEGGATLVLSIVDLTELRTDEDLLRSLAHELSTESGEAYFAAVVRFFGERLGADLAFVGERTTDGEGIRTLAAWTGGAPAPAFAYHLHGSPCSEVLSRGLCVYPDQVSDIFPGDEGLSRLGARGYIGVPLVSSEAESLGILTAVFKRPLERTRELTSAMQIVAPRVAVEVERIRADVRRRHLEEQLTRAQRLESVGRLAGGVAHDFNNLLTPILAYAEMALDDVEEPGGLRDALEEIVQAGERAHKVTRQLLAFSRRQVLEMTSLDLNETLVGFQRMMRSAIREDIRVEAHLDPDLPPIRADRGQIEQVLANLVLNAQDAMPDGGALTLATSVHVVGEDDELPAGAYVLLEVRDTGTGMDALTLAHIFEPFFTTKAPNKGTGLGMSTVYGIVQQHGGGIEVTSAVGEGTTFVLSLPVAEDGGPAAHAVIAHPETSGSERIMVVEDEVAVRRVVVAALRRHGYDVVEVASPIEGLAVALDPSVELQLLVTDVVMPQMDGVELYRRIRTARPDLPVLYLSGYAHDILESRGVTDVNLLQKPFSVKTLTARVREVLDAQ